MSNILSSLKNIPLEPDWQRFEIKVMDAIMTGADKPKTKLNIPFGTISCIIACLFLWVLLATNGRWETTSNRVVNIQLNTREQSIIREFPEIKELLTCAPTVRYSDKKIEEYLKMRYPQWEGEF